MLYALNKIIIVISIYIYIYIFFFLKSLFSVLKSLHINPAVLSRSFTRRLLLI